MILHFGYDLPVAESKALDCDIPEFTSEETKILKNQIRKNQKMIHDYICRIDLFVNQEQYPEREAFVENIRRRLFLLMEENDTFRKTLWKQELLGARSL